MFSSIFQQVFGSRVRVESTAKIAELELAEKVCCLIYSFLFSHLGYVKIHMANLNVPPCVNSAILRYSHFKFFIEIEDKTMTAFIFDL